MPSHARLATTEIRREPVDEVRMQIRSRDHLEEKSVIYAFERFRNVDGNRAGAKRRFLLIEAGRDAVGERKKRRSSGVLRAEAVLGRCWRERWRE